MFQSISLEIDSFLSPNSPLLLVYLPVVLGLLLHLGSQYKEPTSLQVILPLIALNALQAYLCHNSWGQDLVSSLFLSARSTLLFVITALSSIAVYRLGFHPLKKFPGPIKFSLSKWFMVPVDLKGKRPYLMQELHQKYGDIVRFGPREISVNDPDDIASVYGATGLMGKKGTRGPFYTFLTDSSQSRAPNVFNVRTMSGHSEKRRNWDSGFSARALKSYEECIARNVEAALSQVSRIGKDQNTVAVDEIISWFGFDVMGEIGFGKSFGNMESGKTSEAIELIEEAVKMSMAFGDVPYISDSLRLFPNPLLILDQFVSDALQERLQASPKEETQVDIISHLLLENKKAGNVRLSFKELQAEANLVVVAGSDTSSNAICLALFHLINTPGAYQRAQEEVDFNFPSDVADDFGKLKECSYLNAVIQETLRMWPPVPSGRQRVTPPEGIVLSSGIVVPGNIILSTPCFVMHRDHRNFSHPDEFRPERWLDTSKEPVHNAKAFSPFGFGPTGCVGKQLGLMELRLFIARFVQTFDASFASEFDPTAFIDSIKDFFLLEKDSCLIKIKQRVAKNEKT